MMGGYVYEGAAIVASNGRRVMTLDDDDLASAIIAAFLKDNELYVRPSSPPDMSPSMGGPNPGRWHEERSVMSFINKAVETGWLVRAGGSE